MFDAALQKQEDEFVSHRIYLTLERGRDVAMRNLLRKVFLAGGFLESKDGGPRLRRTRIPTAEFRAAITLAGAGQAIDTDEVECILANMIYKVRAHTRRDGTAVDACMHANCVVESNKGLHLAGTWHGCFIQGGGFSGDWCLAEIGRRRMYR
jgi:hypothetical protein